MGSLTVLLQAGSASHFGSRLSSSLYQPWEGRNLSFKFSPSRMPGSFSNAVSSVGHFLDFQSRLNNPARCFPVSNREFLEGEGETLLIHYRRDQFDYEGWGIHVWGDVKEPTSWEAPLQPNGTDAFGAYWEIKLTANAASIHFLVHKGDDKDCNGTLDSLSSNKIWLIQGRPSIFKEKPDPSKLPNGNLSKSKAFWLKELTLAVNPDDLADSFRVYYSSQAALKLTAEGVTGHDGYFPLEKDSKDLPEDVKHKFPYIAHYSALTYKSPPDLPVPSLLKCQLALTSHDATGRQVDATGIQLAGVLDSLFTYAGPLGAILHKDSTSLHLWAPTAQTVELLLFDSPSGGQPREVHTMPESGGVWSTRGPASWQGSYYLYQVRVYHPSTGQVELCQGVDPYSRGLSANGERSLIVDLESPSLFPVGWNTEKPPLQAFNDISVYELHIRDFSACDPSVPPEKRGTYLAFAEEESLGVSHLRSLAASGLTHVHLLPCFDFGSVNEVKTTWKQVDFAALSELPADSELQQAAVAEIKDQDAFNWGYDPVNWGVPEGSYSTDPNGPIRTLEFRTMVQSLNRMGLRVVLDVVYNHVYGSGPHSRLSVLDKLVPGYYLRLSAEGGVESSTCMNNSASEHAMLRRLIGDDLLHWAQSYRVDGFRFDLMGHIPKDCLVEARDSLRSLTVQEHGVDGSKIYMYGEGWDFGEVSRNQRGVNGSQLNMAGTGVGTFNDRLRDSALGGSPFGNPLQQGYLTGLYLRPNSLDQGSPAEQKMALAVAEEWIQLALAGNLRDYEMTLYSREEVPPGTPPAASSPPRLRGSEVLTMDGNPVAYAERPEEVVNYVSAHDNETLFDVILMKSPSDMSLSELCRVNHVATSIIALQQGVAFFHAGDEMLRSKSLDRDSYNSGDWFNRLDFSYGSNNFGVGLPMFEKNGEKWELMRALLSRSDLVASSELIKAASENLREFLRIRYSSPLFRLRSAKEINGRVEFINSMPGVIVLRISDIGILPRIDPMFSNILVVFNMQKDQAIVSVPFESSGMELHPVQKRGHDEIVKLSRVLTTGFIVPGYTTAVFVDYW